MFGVFKPEEWCFGRLVGEATFIFTRLSDGQSFKFSIKDTSFISENMCKEEDFKESYECTIRKNLILKYDNNLNFVEKEYGEMLNIQPLNIIDIDFDGKEEIVITNPCGLKNYYDYNAFKFYNTPDKFDIDREQLKDYNVLSNPRPIDDIYWPKNQPFYFRFNSTFNNKDKTVTIDYRDTACETTTNTYKSDGKGFKLIYQIKQHFDKEDYVAKHYEVDSLGNLKLTETNILKD